MAESLDGLERLETGEDLLAELENECFSSSLCARARMESYFELFAFAFRSMAAHGTNFLMPSAA